MEKEGTSVSRWSAGALKTNTKGNDHPVAACRFIKDLVAIPFSGHANSGVSWDENTDKTHWHWMGKVHNFLETEFLDEIDLNNDSWVPGYMASESGGTSKAETIYLRRTDPGNKKLIGVIMNRTWNWYTIGEGGGCDVNPGAEDILPGYMQSFVTIGFEDEPLKIPEMGFLNQYNIEYFDPGTLETINFETATPIDGKLHLQSYPLLTNARPFVFFKAWRNDEGEQFMPLLDEPLQAGVSRNDAPVFDQQEVQSGISRLSGEDLGIFVWPNPATESLHIETNGEPQGELIVCDALGRTILRLLPGAPYTLDVSTWAPGVYCIYANTVPIRNTYFIVQ